MAPVNDKVQKIINAPEHQLRAALKVFCTSDKKTCDRLWNCLSNIIAMDTQSPAVTTKRKADDGDASEEEGIDDQKRTKLIEDVHHCVRCNMTFRNSENADKACFYHPEELESNEDHDFWADMDDWMGEYEDFQDDNPEAFWFTCCNKDGTTKGCTYGKHWAADDERGPVPFPDAKDVDEGTKGAAIVISDDSESDEEDEEDSDDSD